MIRGIGAVSIVAMLTASPPALAQGKSDSHKKNPPPSRNDLPSLGAPATMAGGLTPFAWIDDATLVEPGAVSISMAVTRWQGTDVGETDLPVIDASVGLTRRVQAAATVPRVIGSADPSGAAGGVGTSYFGAKVAVIDDAKRSVKLSVAPTLEVLGNGVLQSLTPGDRRVHFGFPVSAEVDRGAARAYAGAGYFSRGVWFAGGAVGVRAGGKTFVSAGFNRSWRRPDASVVSLSDRARNEVTGGASYAVTANVTAFGSVARTIATLEQNGAGTTISGGLALFFTPAAKPARPYR